MGHQWTSEGLDGCLLSVWSEWCLPSSSHQAPLYVPSNMSSCLLIANIHIAPCRLWNNYSLYFPPVYSFNHGCIHSFCSFYVVFLTILWNELLLKFRETERRSESLKATQLASTRAGIHLSVRWAGSGVWWSITQLCVPGRGCGLSFTSPSLSSFSCEVGKRPAPMSATSVFTGWPKIGGKDLWWGQAHSRRWHMVSLTLSMTSSNPWTHQKFLTSNTLIHTCRCAF